MSAFVAREEELARLDGAFDRALNGSSSVVFVTGEAGSGKSALVSEFVQRTRSARPDVGIAIGICDAQTGAGDPYLPFREVLDELTGGARNGTTPEAGEATQLARFVRASARALVEHAPDLVDILVPGGAILTRLGGRAVERFDWARRLAEITQGRSDRGRTAESLDQDHIFEQYTALMRAIASEHPLVLVLDDLHWADPASAALLFHLSRRLEHDRVLIVGAYRPVDVAVGRRGERHPLDPILNELQRYHGDVFVRLGDEPEQGRRFVGALVAAEAPGLDADFTEQLFAHTSGHALFTLELLRHLREQGTLRQQPDGAWRSEGRVDWHALPARVEGVIAERAGRLDAAMHELLTVAAVEGQDFTAEVAAAVLSIEPRAVVRSLSGDIEKRHHLVLARGVERLNGHRFAGYSFRHSLFQSYFYGTLDDVERVYLHESVGGAIERLFAGHTDRVAIRLARHYVEAEKPASALPYLLTAGDQARDSCANHEAADRYEQAATVLENARPELTDDDARVLEARISEGKGDLAERSGQHDHALAHYDRALDLLRDGPPVVRARVMRASAKPLETQRRHEEAAERLEKAEQLLGEPPDADQRAWWIEWLQIRIARVWVAYWQGQIDVMREAIDTSRPFLERGASVQRAAMHYCEALLGMRIERFRISDQTLAASQACFDASRQGSQLGEVGLAEFGLGFCHMWRNELDDAERLLRQATETARRAGDRTLESRALVYLSVTMRRAGEVDAAAEWADVAQDAARDAQLDEYIGTVHAQRAWIAWRRGDMDSAEREADAALEQWTIIPYEYPLVFLGMLPLMAVRTSRGDHAAAAELAPRMLPSPMARLPERLEQALRAVADAQGAGAADLLADRLNEVVEAARDAGYL